MTCAIDASVAEGERGRLTVTSPFLFFHTTGCSRDQAIDYMLTHSAMGKSDATAEVERYIAIPGQALAYKIGQLTILKLKAEAQAKQGPRFDPRGFHAAVLDSGALPMPVLENKVRAWMAK